jgi:hypothetical protein
MADPPPWAYVVAFAVQVALGVFLQTIWIVGPLFVVLTVHLLPSGRGRAAPVPS